MKFLRLLALATRDVPVHPVDLNPSLARWFCFFALVLIGNATLALVFAANTVGGVVVITTDVIVAGFLLWLAYDLSWSQDLKVRDRKRRRRLTPPPP